MKKLLLIPLLLLSLTTMAACSTTDDTPDTPSGNGNMLVLYFSAEGHTQAIAERIVQLTGAELQAQISIALRLPNRMLQILTMTATAFSMKPIMTCALE